MTYLYTFSGDGACNRRVSASANDNFAEMVSRNGGGEYVVTEQGHDPGRIYLDAGVLVVMPERPGEHHTFDYALRQWQDPRTLQDLKDARWEVIKASRGAAELGAFAYNGLEFDGDLDAQRRLAAYISVSKSAIATGTSFSAEFTLANDTLVTLTAQDFVGIELAKVLAVAAAFAHAAALRAQLADATTPEQVAEVVWASP